MARIRNPDATIQMSITGWCLSQKQYASWTAMYTAITTARSTEANRLTASEPASSTPAVPAASRTGTIPAAMGRLRLVGWARSSATSLMSLIR